LFVDVASFVATLNQHPLEKDHTWMARERKTMADIAAALGSLRKVRDAVYERAFTTLFEGQGQWAPDETPTQD
jgi:hypothetical protein